MHRLPKGCFATVRPYAHQAVENLPSASFRPLRAFASSQRVFSRLRWSVSAQSRCQYPVLPTFAAKLTASGSFHQCGGFPSLVALFYPNVPSTDSVIKKPL